MRIISVSRWVLPFLIGVSGRGCHEPPRNQDESLVMEIAK
jgi:hypothetical protein